MDSITQYSYHYRMPLVDVSQVDTITTESWRNRIATLLQAIIDFVVSIFRKLMNRPKGADTNSRSNITHYPITSTISLSRESTVSTIQTTIAQLHQSLIEQTAHFLDIIKNHDMETEYQPPCVHNTEHVYISFTPGTTNPFYIVPQGLDLFFINISETTHHKNIQTIAHNILTTMAHIKHALVLDFATQKQHAIEASIALSKQEFDASMQQLASMPTNKTLDHASETFFKQAAVCFLIDQRIKTSQLALEECNNIIETQHVFFDRASQASIDPPMPMIELSNYHLSSGRIVDRVLDLLKDTSNVDRVFSAAVSLFAHNIDTAIDRLDPIAIRQLSTNVLDDQNVSIDYEKHVRLLCGFLTTSLPSSYGFSQTNIAHWLSSSNVRERTKYWL